MIEILIEPIPDYGDLFTLDEFMQACKEGCFVDYDGAGNYATSTQMTDIEIRPSDVTKCTRPIYKEYTHVVWFNKYRKDFRSARVANAQRRARVSGLMEGYSAVSRRNIPPSTFLL